MRLPFVHRPGTPSASLVELVRNLVSDSVRLVKVERALIKSRFSRTLKRAGIAAGILAGAATFLFLGFVGLLVTSGLALGIVLPAWVAALIVAGALLLVGTVAGLVGRAQARAAVEARTSGPVEIETERQDTRYRLEADVEALSTKLDPRHRVRLEEAHGGATDGHVR